MEIERDICTYVLIRTDIPSMNSGKKLAQIHHAGVQMAVKYNSNSLFQEYIEQGARNGADSFSTTIVLGAPMTEIEQIIEKLAEMECFYGIIIDPSYPFLVDKEITPFLNSNITFIKTVNETHDLVTRSELTCAWCVGDRNQIIFREVFENLSLHQ